MLIKIHNSYRDIIAICDKELYGKRFEQGKMQVKVGEFFNGEEKSIEEVKNILINAKKEDATFNIVGEKACKLALDCGIIGEKGIKKIQEVPVALVLF
jgi:hypothetical protein